MVISMTRRGKMKLHLDPWKWGFLLSLARHSPTMGIVPPEDAT